MKIKRLLAFIISVAMIVGMVPTFVFAKELDLEADEPETTEAAEAEEEEEEKEEPAESEDKEDADEEKDEDADESDEDDADDDEDLNAPVEANVIVGKAPSQSEEQSEEKSESASRAAVGSRIGKSNVYWSFSGGTLTVYGRGKMPAWKTEASVPWHSHRKDITRIIVRAGITTIGNFAFSNLTNSNFDGGVIWSYARGKYRLKSIGNYAFYHTGIGGIPEFKTVTSIGAHVFEGSGLYGDIKIPKNVTKLGVYCFASNNALNKVAINGKLKAIPKYCFYKS